MIRSGAEYVRGLRDGRTVLFNGERNNAVVTAAAGGWDVELAGGTYALRSNWQFGDILYRAGHISGLNQRERTMKLADHYLEPPVAEFPLMAYRVAERIAGEFPDKRCLLISGYTDEEGQGAADSGLGAQIPVLAKPFTRQELARALHATTATNKG